MKQLIILLLSIITVEAMAQDMPFRRVRTDTLASRDDKIYISNRKGSLGYIRTHGDTLYFGDASGEYRLNATYDTLTDASVVYWNTLKSLKRTLTIATDRTLVLGNLRNGMSGDLILTVSDISTLTLPSGSNINGNVTSLDVGRYHLCWTYDGSVLDFNIAVYTPYSLPE